MKLRRSHNIPDSAQLKEVFDTEVATIFFYDNIVIVEALEGVTLSYKTSFSVLVKGLKYMGNRPWVYISNRVHSYSVNPNDYKYLNEIPSLKAIAIVNYTETGRKNAQLEAAFCKKPFKVFDDLTGAYEWVKQKI
jgi:hypothetical protein